MDWGEHFSSLALNYAAVAIMLLDKDGIIHFANAQAEEYFQIPASQIEGKHIHALVHAPSKQRSHKRIDCTLVEKIFHSQPYLRQSDVFLRKGVPFWVEYSLYPLVDSQGVTAYLLSFLDAEVAFRGKENYLQSRAKYRMTFEMSHDAKVILDRDGTIEEANPAATSFFSKNQLVQENFFQLFPQEGRAKLKELWRERRRQTIRLHPLEFVKPNDEELFIELTIVSEILPDKALIIFRDTTARVMEQRQRDRFLALVGHELRTPLAVIKAFTQLMQSTTKSLEDKKIDRYLQHIHEKTDLLTGLINGMMDAIHLGSGKLQFDDQALPIDDLVKQIVFEFKKTFPTDTFLFSGETQTILPLDKHRITQVISNLISNAIKYSSTPATVKVLLEKKPKHVLIQVTDSGKGIPKAEQAKLFLPFFRGKAAREGKAQGLGLGLYLARQIIRHYKGSMSVQSKYGKGSTFTISLPIED